MVAPMKRREETGERGTRGQAVWAERMEAAIANTDPSLGFSSESHRTLESQGMRVRYAVGGSVRTDFIGTQFSC